MGEENTIYSLENNNGEVVEGTDGVISLSHEFYQNLYKSEIENTQLQDELLNKIDKKIGEDSKILLEQPITKIELKDALLSSKKINPLDQMD